MSKDQKKTINLPMEIVENFKETLEWACSTIYFWKLDKIWPTNLILTELEHLNSLLDFKKETDNVSLSHIIDK